MCPPSVVNYKGIVSEVTWFLSLTSGRSVWRDQCWLGGYCHLGWDVLRLSTGRCFYWMEFSLPNHHWRTAKITSLSFYNTFYFFLNFVLFFFRIYFNRIGCKYWTERHQSLASVAFVLFCIWQRLFVIIILEYKYQNQVH